MILFLILASSALSAGKIYSRCGLARELKYVHKAPSHQIATWVCIAEHESGYNTSIVGYLSGDGSGDHGLFQISDKYWCSPPNKGFACGVTCAQLEDDDIADDFNCAQKIYKEHKELTGDGFNAWAVYNPHCKGHKADKYIKDCFNDFDEPKEITPSAPSAFAHGFFDTGAGKTTKFTVPFEKTHPFFTPTSSFLARDIFPGLTEKSTFNAFELPRVSVNNKFPPTTNLPSSFLTQKTTSFFPNVLSTTSSAGVNDFIIFNNPTTSSIPSSNHILFTPSTSTSSSILSTNRRSLTIESNFSPASSSDSFLNPTATTMVYQSNKILSEPVFIINGVKWY